MELRVTEVERFFKSIPTPEGPIQLDQANKIVYPEIFIRSHLKTARAYIDSPACLPYLKRLEQLQIIIQQNHD